MRTERRPDGSVVEIREITHCSGCGQPFQLRLFTMSWQNCSCAGGHGHRVAVCLRDGCRAQTFDPPHDGTTIQAPLEGHRTGPDWDNVQHGPTLDLGDG